MSETVKRGRKAIEVTPFELQVALSALEATNTFPNRSALWVALEESEWAKTRTPRPLSSQTAMVMATKNNLNINTPVGKRGKEKGCGPVIQVNKRKEFPEIAAKAMRRLFPLKMKTVDKAIKGSFKAAIKLKCLDCTCGDIVEIRQCEIVECSLWAFRPYKG